MLFRESLSSYLKVEGIGVIVKGRIGCSTDDLAASSPFARSIVLAGPARAVNM